MEMKREEGGGASALRNQAVAYNPGGHMTAVDTNPGVVADPVGHISISGVHGRDELDERLAHAPNFKAAGSPLKPLVIGAAIGAAIVYLLKR
jgi:hypothetical protein